MDRIGGTGQQDDRQVSELRVRLDAAAQVDAAVAWQEQVSQHQVKSPAREELKPTGRIPCDADLEAGVLQEEGQFLSLGRTVLDEQYTGHGSILGSAEAAGVLG